jgi:predicted nucleic acid-binding protein
MAASRLFVDTWGWLVLANRRDPSFPEVARMRAEAADRKGAWVTTDYVLDETITRLFATTPLTLARRYVEGIFEAAQLGLVNIEHVNAERFTAAWRLRLQFEDKPRISFTDLTTFVVMRELRIEQALTGDAHFEHVGMRFVRVP